MFSNCTLFAITLSYNKLILKAMYKDLDEFFKVHGLFSPTLIYEMGATQAPDYRSTDTNKVEKYVINPEWHKQNLKEQIGLIERKLDNYDKKIDQLISLKGEIEDQKKELEKQLKDLDKSK